MPHQPSTVTMGVSGWKRSFSGVKKVFLSYCMQLKVSTVAGLYRDLKNWYIMVTITMTTTTSCNLSTNRTAYASCVHFCCAFRQVNGLFLCKHVANGYYVSQYLTCLNSLLFSGFKT